MTPSSEQPSASAPAPQAAPPGWYPDTAGTGILRWWDGAQWGPQAPAATAAASRQPGPSWWAWAVAFSPLLWLGAAAAVAVALGPSVNLSGPGPVLIGWVITAVFAVIAARKDTLALRAAGERSAGTSTWWCLFIGWPYLLGRLIRLRNRRGIDGTLLAVAVLLWIGAAIAVGTVASSAQSAGTVLNQAKLQSELASALKARTGDAATVNCPADPSMSPGSQFECAATFSDGSTAIVTVTVQDSQGDVIWKVNG